MNDYTTTDLSELKRRFEDQARQIEGMSIDLGTYEEAKKDPWVPILVGSGRLDSNVGFFGRDPGRDEVRKGDLFVGPAGERIVRQMTELDLKRVNFFWANTVPYKPIGNKPWPVRIKRAFRALNVELIEAWHGSDLITFGNHAFFWFGIDSVETRQKLSEYWKGGSIEDRYTGTTNIICGEKKKTIRLHPLPHPSGLNTKYGKYFDGWLKQRLEQLSDRM